MCIIIFENIFFRESVSKKRFFYILLSSMEFDKLSPCAKTCVENFLLERRLKSSHIYLHENVDHDGHDKYGYKSNLWDVFIFYKTEATESSPNYNVAFFHREEWYCNTAENYSLWKEYSLNEFRYGFSSSILRQKNIIICKNIGL